MPEPDLETVEPNQAENRLSGAYPEGYTRDVRRMIRAERKYIEERRKSQPWYEHHNHDKSPADNRQYADEQEPRYLGLAISGGGIRSAAFAIGAMQKLHQAKILPQFDYMSTVSGGGYAGGALTWFLSNSESKDQYFPGDGFGGRRFNMIGTNFPFREKEGAVSEHDAEQTGLPFKRDIIDYIRQRSAYMQPGAGLDAFSATIVVVRSMLTSLTAYLSILSFLFALTLWSLGYLDGLLPYISSTAASLAGLFDVRLGAWMEDGRISGFLKISLCLFAVLVLIWVLYSLFTAFPWSKKRAVFFRSAIERYGGLLTKLTVGLFLVGLLDQVYRQQNLFGFGLGDWSEMAAPAVTGLGALGGLVSRYLLSANRGLKNPIIFAVVTTGSVSLLTLGFAMISVILGHRLHDLLVGGDIWIFAGLFAGFFLFWCYANINFSGLHRMYRDRLMVTFMPSRQTVREDNVAGATPADLAKVHDMCGPGTDGPYHIINTNVVLTKGENARFRSRRGDSFILSPLFSGSEATGWVRTDQWLIHDKSQEFGLLNRYFLKPVWPVTLPTAVAISGAALNPRTGADGRGPTKKFSLSLMLNLLNLRLGYWIPNPNPEGQNRRFLVTRSKSHDGKARKKLLRSRIFPPNFLYPGFLQSLIGLRTESESGWIELSDGGHFDNTGLYELFRRRQKTIVFLDGSADPQSRFSSFSNALEKAFIDFGVTVEFFDKDEHDPMSSFSFQNMVQGSGREQDDPVSEILNFSKFGFSVGEIFYPDEQGRRSPKTGDDRCFLFYIKTSMIKGLPARLYSYKSENAQFPDEPTSDQFFSEQQFEAYRILGFFLAEQMIRQVRHFRPLAQALKIDGSPAGDQEENWPVMRK
ncbi:patatin-like phospholipase family protein [Parasphingorhabdus sp.]|uniref:patatin-like phospholipase family protein n=1 Tax=Parasphingorhabdus sp. TaxID=2709688 RepID=UPI003C780A16